MAQTGSFFFEPAPDSGSPLSGQGIALQMQLMVQAAASQNSGKDRPLSLIPNSLWMQGPRLSDGGILWDLNFWDGQIDRRIFSLDKDTGEVIFSSSATYPIFLAGTPAVSIPASTSTVAPFASPTIDTHGSFSSGTFKPSVSGYYLLMAQYSSIPLPSINGHWIGLAKNGVLIANGTYGTGGGSGSSISIITHLNGSSDSVSMRLYAGAATTLAAGAGYMSAFLIRGDQA